jgi:hypothetical protein
MQPAKGRQKKKNPTLTQNAKRKCKTAQSTQFPFTMGVCRVVCPFGYVYDHSMAALMPMASNASGNGNHS